jgi:hypothetical protein
VKMEYGGTGNKASPIKVYHPGSLSEFLLSRIENFRFPLEQFSCSIERGKELEIDRQYNLRCIHIVYFSPKGDSIYGVARIISKNSPSEKLPIEFSQVVRTTETAGNSPFIANYNGKLTIKSEETFLPACEISGLKVISTQNGISIKERYYALDAIIDECDIQAHQGGFRTFFLSCAGHPQLERLYHDKCYFNTAAEVKYDNSPTLWKALWRFSGQFRKKY